MAFKMNAGKNPTARTGAGVPSALLQGGFVDTVKKVGRTALAVAKTAGNQLFDYVQPDASVYGGVGSRASKDSAQFEKGRENASHQDVIDQANQGKIYSFAGKIAKSNQDTGYSRSQYDSDKDYQDKIDKKTNEYRGYVKSKKK